jgi:hypothetical protein
MSDHKHGPSCSSTPAGKDAKGKPMQQQGGSCGTMKDDKGGKKGGSCS